MSGDEGWLLAPERVERRRRRAAAAAPPLPGTSSDGPWSLCRSMVLVLPLPLAGGELKGACAKDSSRLRMLSSRATMGAAELAGAETVSRSETLPLTSLMSTLGCNSMEGLGSDGVSRRVSDGAFEPWIVYERGIEDELEVLVSLERRDDADVDETDDAVEVERSPACG